jgi:hypothetical protein
VAIKDGIFGYVSGTVGRMFDTKNGSAFVLEVAREGSQYPDKITVWGAADLVRPGDRAAVKGWISWRREVKDDKTYFNVSVNKPELTEHEPASSEPAAGWSEPPQGFNTEVPF